MAGFQKEIQFKLQHPLHHTLQVSQSALAKDQRVGPGMNNFCFQALAEKNLAQFKIKVDVIIAHPFALALADAKYQACKRNIFRVD